MKNTWEMFEYLKEILGSDRLLDELAQALSSDELRENLEYIANMWDIDFDSDE